MNLLQYNVAMEPTWQPRFIKEQTGCASSMEFASVSDIPKLGSEQEQPSEAIILPDIQSGDRQFVLRRKLIPSLSQEGALWTCELENLRIMGYGDSSEQAIENFMEDFAVTYDGLAHEEDEYLSQDAQDIRDELIRLVVRVITLSESLVFRSVWDWGVPSNSRRFARNSITFCNESVS